MNHTERRDGRRAPGRRNYSGFASGWQVFVNGVDGQLRAYRETMAPRQYAATIHQLSLRVERELRSPHVARWLDEAA